MRQYYNVVMDDGTFIRIDAESAGNAIMKALKAHRGHRAKECYLGDVMGLDGRISFEIPPHQPLGKHKPRKRQKPPTELFNDQLILAESEQAKAKEEKP